MKRIKVIACVLAATMLAGVFAGCSKTTKITTDKFVKACEKLKLEEFELDSSDSPDQDDLEGGIYAYADEDYIEDNPEVVESILEDLRLSEVIDSDDISSFAFAVKCSGVEDAEDVTEPSDLEDLVIDGAFALQMTLADDGYAEDFMDYLDDMLDLANISTKDLSNKEFYVSKNEGYFRFHVDVAQLAKIVLENDDIMDVVDEYSDADEFEEALNALKGDVSVSVEINGTNIFIIMGGAINTKSATLDSFAKAFGAASNPAKVPMNKDVVSEAIEDAFDTYGRYLGLTATVFSSVVGVASATLFQLRI